MTNSFYTRSITILLTILFFTELIAQSTSGVLDSSADRERIPLKAYPFDLSLVKILEGPFKKAMELNAAYLLELEADRLLSRFRSESGLEQKAEAYGGWEQETIAGHSLGHYLSACAMMFASTGEIRFCERVNYIVDELEVCQNAIGTGFVAAFPGGKKAFNEIAAGDIRSKPFDLNGIWVPLYTLHKQIAGLLDAHHFCSNNKALKVAIRLADWIDSVTSKLTEDQFQLMLATEHGGMNEVLAELYARTGNKKYLNLSLRFHHKNVLDPLSNKIDKLQGLHANTQIPKLIGLARRYKLTGDENDRTAAEFFWDRVVHHHSYVIGGNSENESFGEPDKLNERLGYSTCETCNTYNMLKLTRHLFTLNPSVEYADFYERALYNHILASQNPDSGMFCYYVTLKPGGYKTYSDRFNSFWCCVGSGMENHSKYGESIYFHNENDLWINLFIASELNWEEKGIIIKQETSFPESGEVKFKFKCENPVELDIHLRCPFWAEEGLSIYVNRKESKHLNPPLTVYKPGTFTAIKRVWKDGDIIEMKVPKSLRLEPMPDNPGRAAIFYGPLVLAGELGPEDDTEAQELIYVPSLVTESKSLTEWLKPVQGARNTFKTLNVGMPNDVILSPFYKMHNKRYNVYWDFLTDEQWNELEQENKKEKERQLKLEELTIDFIQPGEVESEKSYNQQGEKTEPGEGIDKKWRLAYWGGWFSYDIKSLSDKPVSLVCTYWGGDGDKRTFDILIDGELITTEQLQKNKPGRYFDVVYKIPENITHGKDKLSVKFQAHPDNTAGGVYGIRIITGHDSLQ